MSFPPSFPPQPSLPEPDYRPPLVQHLQRHRREEGPGFTLEGLYLPDDPDGWRGRRRETPLPGFDESVLLEITPQVDREEVEMVGAALVRLTERGDRDSRASVEIALEATHALWLAPALARWLQGAGVDPARLRIELRRLLQATSARETAKVCLWLLAEVGHAEDAGLAELFAAHGEFARYGAHALAALAADAADRL
ncbi:MAG TPA: hypothetical protein VER55_01415, partial [Ardenticatenaceae bacterium]|nr:hypothetical protein [Ardenticatenaceae bacterium]